MKKPIFAMIPSGYKASTLYTPIPIDSQADMTFERSTPATRMNKDGLIEEVAANVPRLDYQEVIKTIYYNLFAYTNNLLNNSYWVVSGNTRTEIDDYEGSSAIKLESSSDPDPRFQQNANTGLVTSRAFTYSIVAWIDEGQDTDATLIVFGSTSVEQLQQRAITLTTTPTRYEIVKTFTGSAISTSMTCRFDLNPNTNTYAYVTKPQLEESNGSTKYQETKTDEGFGTDFKIANCPTLLLEGASSNLINYSEDLSQTYWNDGGQIRTLSGISPSGGLAYLVEKGTTGYMAGQSVGGVDGNTYTISAWLKSDNNSTIILKLQELGGDFTNYFTKTITLTNEWVRYEATGVIGVDGNPARFVFDSIQDGESFYAWGVQVEENEVATSYIKTTGATVSRGTDNCTNALSSTLYKGMENQGSLYFSFYNIQDGRTFKSLTLSNSSTSNRVLLRQNGNTDITAYILNSTGTLTALGYTINPDKGFYKVCFIWEQDNCRLYVDGVLRGQDLTVDLTSSLPYTDFSFDGGGNSGDLLTGRHKELRLYNETLTEAEAIELTTI